MRNHSRLLSDGWLSCILAIVLIVIDQVIKIEVKTNMFLGETRSITDRFYIDFIEKHGMELLACWGGISHVWSKVLILGWESFA